MTRWSSINERVSNPAHDKQRERQRELDDDERVASSRMPVTAGAGAAAQHALDVGARRLPGGHHAEQDARGDRHDERERERRSVDANSRVDRELFDEHRRRAISCRTRRCTRPATPPTIDSSTLSVSSCCAIRRTSRAECGADRQLAMASGAARELKVRDVRAGDEQHEPDGREDDEDRRARRADDLLLQRLKLDAEALVRRRIRRLLLRGERSQVALRISERHAGLDRSERANAAVAALEAAGVRIVSDREVGVGRAERRLNPRRAKRRRRCAVGR